MCIKNWGRRNYAQGWSWGECFRSEMFPCVVTLESTSIHVYVYILYISGDSRFALVSYMGVLGGFVPSNRHIIRPRR